MELVNDDACALLDKCYGHETPPRYYHTRDVHLARLLELLKQHEAAERWHNPRAAGLAMLFHECVTK